MEAEVFDVHFGEAFVVGFITVAVLSARFWPKLGELVAVRLTRRSGAQRSKAGQPQGPAQGGG
jgi:hypothetical protein